MTTVNILTPADFSYHWLQMVDLGEPPYSHGSVGGCHLQDMACSSSFGGCGERGHCTGGLQQPWCECAAGWTGPRCATPTLPARLGSASYMKVALSFTPGLRVMQMQVRVRFRGARTGMLLQLAAHHRAAALTLHVSVFHSSLFFKLSFPSVL